jgi:hypothetical protein
MSGYSSRSLRRYAKAGRVPGAYRIGKAGKWRFRRDLFCAWLDSLVGLADDPTPTKKQRMKPKPAWAIARGKEA